MEEKSKVKVKQEYQYLLDIIRKMTNLYVRTVHKIKEENNTELLDFHARRLVEMAGRIIASYLLVHDADKDEMFAKSADIYIDMLAHKILQQLIILHIQTKKI